MKKCLFVVTSIFITLAIMLSACSAHICHKCGKSIEDDPVEAGGRTYCSYNCYMNELFN